MTEFRTATLERQTSESKVRVSLDLDGSGRTQISTGVGFFDHMLTAFAVHSLIDLEVESAGDWHIDAHHTVEDTAIALGQAIRWTRLWRRRWLTYLADRTACTPVSRPDRSTC